MKERSLIIIIIDLETYQFNYRLNTYLDDISEKQLDKYRSAR